MDINQLTLQLELLENEREIIRIRQLLDASTRLPPVTPTVTTPVVSTPVVSTPVVTAPVVSEPVSDPVSDNVAAAGRRAVAESRRSAVSRNSTPARVYTHLQPYNRDSRPYAISRRYGPTLRDTIKNIFRVANITSRSHLDEWCGSEGTRRLHDYVRHNAANHWYSHRHLKSAEAHVRSIIIEILGPLI